MKSRILFCVVFSIPVFLGLCLRQASTADWPMLGRDGTRNAVSPEKHPPLDWAVGAWDPLERRWDNEKARNIKWRARSGDFRTYSTPVVADGHVYIGTDSSGGHVKGHSDSDRYGYLLCFRASDGQFLWHFPANELEGYGWRYAHPGLGSSPLVEGDRLWFVSNRWEVVCLDTEGFQDDEDDGPVTGQWSRLFVVFPLTPSDDPNAKKYRLTESLDGLKRGVLTDWLQRQFYNYGMSFSGDTKVAAVEGSEHWTITARVRGVNRQFELRMERDKLVAYQALTKAAKEEADVVWRYDLRKELKVVPYSHIFGNANRQCSPVSYGNRLYVVTANGTEQRSNKIPSPEAPSLVCFDKKTGKVLWTDASPGENILMGQFSSPLVAEVDGRAQVIVAQGDGWVRSFDALTGKLIWKFDINAKESEWLLEGTRGKRDSILATPVLHKGRIYVGSGKVAEYGDGPGRLVCIDATKTGDISTELAVDDKGRPLPQRRFQAVVRKNGERAIPNPNSGLIWEFTASDENSNGELEWKEVFHWTASSVVVKNDLLIAVDYSGLIHCFDARTGKRFWEWDLFGNTYCSPLIVDEWVYVPNENGDVAIFRLSADPDVAMKKVGEEYRPHAEITMDSSVDGTPVFADGVLYIASGSNLWAIATPEEK